MIRVGVDVGGTFTDLVALDGRQNPDRQGAEHARGSVRRCDARLEAVDAADVAAFAHGMTVATNALLERRGARTALVTTEGFRDLIELARQDRPALYDLAERRPEPLVPRDLRFTVRERMGPDGEVEPLDDDSVRRGGRGAARGRGRGGRGVPAVRVPAPRARAPRRRGGARGARRRPRLALERGAAGVPRVRALLDHRRRRLPGAEARRLPRAPGGERGGGRRAGAAGHAVLGRRARRRRRRRAGGRLRALRPGRRRGRRGARRARERLRGRADLRHGRHEHGRRAGARRRGEHDDRVGRRRASRSSCRWSTSTPSAPAAARSPGPTRAARCASARARRAPTPARPPTARAARSRRSPTPTCCSATSATARSWAAS